MKLNLFRTRIKLSFARDKLANRQNPIPAAVSTILAV
jgi:hypothetical protein